MIAVRPAPHMRSCVAQLGSAGLCCPLKTSTGVNPARKEMPPKLGRPHECTMCTKAAAVVRDKQPSRSDILSVSLTGAARERRKLRALFCCFTNSSLESWRPRFNTSTINSHQFKNILLLSGNRAGRLSGVFFLRSQTSGLQLLCESKRPLLLGLSRIFTWPGLNVAQLKTAPAYNWCSSNSLRDHFTEFGQGMTFSLCPLHL